MSEFEEFARSQGFSGDFQRGCNGQYKSDLLHFMEKAFMHQQAKIDRLNSVLDERTKEWLQAIECGTYFENVAKPLKAENDELQKRIDEVCDLLDRAEVNHKHLLTKYQSTKAMEMSSSKILSRVDQILNDLNESMKDFKEMDLYDKGYRVAFEYVIADLEKALRGGHD